MRIPWSKRKLSHISRLSRKTLINRSCRRELPSPLPKERPPTSELLKEERDFSGTSHVFVYVMLPSRIINMECELVNPDGLMDQLKQLKSIGVDGVSVNTWWGIVEANNPRDYNWDGYKQLFRMVLEAGFNKIQVVMSFHECDDHDPHISLPKWIKEIGQQNPDIYFTDKDGRRNPECLSWGIDDEPVLKGRTAVEVLIIVC
ncbi:hypothetical protein QVD17_21586 [Tagetes erecta]|uniref:Beta-amylase n=1 Tax=Tagetes erecta TaxID=13708 RepID=A0AAD8KC63_TARER|nr:hypothetical protein QVD17_21586 [Tagetes erecta]